MAELPILIAGPTASGKSALAVALAERLGGVVVNADSRQVYAGWRILTARPPEAETARVPHRLFGHVPLGTPYSVGAWLGEIAPLISGARPVIVGGTGLYFAALTEGLAEIPEVPPGVRASAEARLAKLGREAFARELAARDPETAAGLDLANPRRVQRAWEVLEATGRGLARWQAETPPPLLPRGGAAAFVLSPEPAALNARIDARFDAMLAEGALAEVEAVMARGLPEGAPGLEPVGAAELAAYLAGRMGREEAVARAKTATRQYAKRQRTWLRRRMAGWTWLPADDPATALATALDRVS